MTYTLTLRNARRLDQDLEKLLARIAEETQTTRTISVFRDIYKDDFNQMQQKILDKVATYRDILGFRYKLRELIRTTNATLIDSLTVQLAREEVFQRYVSGLVIKKDPPDPYSVRRRKESERAVATDEADIVVLNKQLEAMRESVKNGQAQTTLELNLMTKALINNIDLMLGTSKNSINSLKDQLQKANNETKITVTTTDVINKVFIEYKFTVG